MNIYDYEAVKRHICIENVAYHLCLEPKERVGNEIKVICPLQHKKVLKNLGFLDSSIENGLYRSIPKNYIKRRLLTNTLSKEFNLSGCPGFYQEEDLKWCFARNDGFFIPIFDKDGYIEGMSIHLDKPYNDNRDIWFSSNNKINGTQAKSWIMRNNIKQDTDTVILTDNLLLGNYIKETINTPIIAFQNITNSYMILREIEKTNIRNIVFVLKVPYINDNLDYITNRVFRDLIPLGYNLDIKCVKDYKEILNIDFNECYNMGYVA